MYGKIMFYAFLFTAAFSFNLLFFGQAQSQTKSIRNYYTGTIGDKYKISMDLTIENLKVNGFYCYNTQGKTINLSGDIDAKWNFNMSENIDGNASGNMKGTFVNSFSGIRGDWFSIDGKKKLTLSLDKAAEYITVKDKKYNVSVTYPKFKMKNFAAQIELNGSIAKTMFGYLDSGKVALKEAIDDAGNDTSLVSSYSYETTGSIDYISESIASILCTGYVYSGGAHPTYYFFNLNYFIKPGSVKEIELADFFKPKTDYAVILSDLCIAELKKNEVSSIVNGEITDMSDLLKSGVVACTINPAGLNFNFSPYTIGSYADGSFDCIVKYSKIKNIIDPDGILGEFVKK